MFRIFSIVIFMVISPITNCEESWDDIAFVKASVVSSKVYSSPSNREKIYAGEFYKVNFKVLEVVDGELNKKTINGVLFASHIEHFSAKKKIYLLVKSNGVSEEILNWSPVREVACFPEESISKYGLDDSFFIKDDYSKTRCAEVGL